jgi:hypothetical protein
LGLSTTITVEVKSKMNLIDRIMADLVSENIVFVDNTLQVDINVGFIKVFDGEELHEELAKYKV